MNPVASVFMENRVCPGSTEMTVYLDTPLDEFWLTLHAIKGEAIAFIRFKRFGDEVILGRRQGLFGAVEARPALDPCPGPVISWSGVLSTRPAALEAEKAIRSYLRGLPPMTRSGAPGAEGVVPRAA